MHLWSRLYFPLPVVITRAISVSLFRASSSYCPAQGANSSSLYLFLICHCPCSLWPGGHHPFLYNFTFFPNLDHVWQQQVPPNCLWPPVWCHNLHRSHRSPMDSDDNNAWGFPLSAYCWFPSSPNCFSQVKVMLWFHLLTFMQTEWIDSFRGIQGSMLHGEV